MDDFGVYISDSITTFTDNIYIQDRSTFAGPLHIREVVNPKPDAVKNIETNHITTLEIEQDKISGI